MTGNLSINWTNVFYFLLALMGMGVIISLVLLGWVVWRVRRINLPPGADFFTALRATPLSVVILLDLLDLSLDIFGAPFAWTILTYLGLKPLRGVTILESLIPGTQFIPTMTVAWVIARQINPDVRVPSR
ncbi:MAG TPA: hypothetical protein VE136_06930 [Anaerolineales bacterium]|nr:hypothetical protein [Anaerolineales bacterium]